MTLSNNLPKFAKDAILHGRKKHVVARGVCLRLVRIARRAPSSKIISDSESTCLPLSNAE